MLSSALADYRVTPILKGRRHRSTHMRDLAIISTLTKRKQHNDVNENEAEWINRLQLNASGIFFWEESLKIFMTHLRGAIDEWGIHFWNSLLKYFMAKLIN